MRASDGVLAIELVQLKVPNKTSKKHLILDLAQARGLERAGVGEIHAIASDMRRRLGHKTSPSYIANVLRQAGTCVEYNDPYGDPRLDEPYASRLKNLLEFANFESAEASLQKLDTVYREYRGVADRVGTCLVRSLALKGKQRAESLASNARVSPEKRREKQEIARWFRVWLEVSDLFFDWLELRKQSEEFRQLFPNADGHARPNSLSPAE